MIKEDVTPIPCSLCLFHGRRTTDNVYQINQLSYIIECNRRGRAVHDGPALKYKESSPFNS